MSNCVWMVLDVHVTILFLNSTIRSKVQGSFQPSASEEYLYDESSVYTFWPFSLGHYVCIAHPMPGTALCADIFSKIDSEYSAMQATLVKVQRRQNVAVSPLSKVMSNHSNSIGKTNEQTEPTHQ
jgi:hypothetical protein